MVTGGQDRRPTNEWTHTRIVEMLTVQWSEGVLLQCGVGQLLFHPSTETLRRILKPSRSKAVFTLGKFHLIKVNPGEVALSVKFTRMSEEVEKAKTRRSVFA
ncbi:hypothetical protein SRHO_G00147660 [Serrasalmus rhombeus]